MKGKVSVKDLPAGENSLEVRAWRRNREAEGEPLEKTHEIVCTKKSVFFVDREQKMPAPYRLTLGCPNDICYTKGEMTTLNILCKVTDDKGNPVADMPVTYSIIEPLASQALRSKKNTDKNGELQIVYFVNEPGIISFSAGAEQIGPDQPDIKTGDIKHISIYYSEFNEFRQVKEAAGAADKGSPATTAESQAKPEEGKKAQ
jgi:hypothetical protein